MEGAASAANSRSTSHAASRAQSPDLPFSQHVQDHSPEASLQHDSHLQGPSLSELQVGHASPMQQQLPAANEAADHDFSQAASQPGSSHSSPAVSKQQSSSPSVNRAAAAQAFLVPVETTAAALLSPEASAAESNQTADTSVQESPNSDALLFQQSRGCVSYEQSIREISSDDMRRHSDSLRYHESECKLSPDIHQMQPASAMSGHELAMRPHEAPDAHDLPQALTLHPTASLPSDHSQCSCSDEHSLQAEIALQAPVSPEACRQVPCNSNGSSADCGGDTAAELHTDTVGIPAAPAIGIIQSGSSCEPPLDGKALQPGGCGSTGTLLCSQAPFSTRIAAEGSRTTLGSSTSPATASSSAAVVEADTVPSIAQALQCLPSDTGQTEAAPAQHTSEHSGELESPLNQMHACQSATSQSGSSNQVSHQTEQSKSGRRAASSQGRSFASSNVDLLAADEQDQQERHFSSLLQVCKH